MKRLLFVLVVVCTLPFVFANDEYKPYLHEPTVPESPQVQLYGTYATNLFPGAGTYSYSLEVPPGTNGLQPSLSISYNSQSVKQRPSFLGAGWSLPQNYVMRHVNFTPSNTSDDFFVLVLNGVSYDLIFDGTYYHTETETFSRIEKLNTTTNDAGAYWLVTLKDGTRLRFGFTSDSELYSSRGYAVKCSLDRIEDVHNNSIVYTYLEDPFVNDNGSVYLDSIVYNTDGLRRVSFSYEGADRPDMRLVFEQGNPLLESRRLSDVSMFYNGSLVRRYHFDFVNLNAEGTVTGLRRVSYFGNDNVSQLHDVDFGYHSPGNDYYNSTEYELPIDPGTQDQIIFANSEGEDQGYRLVDLNNDGFVDIHYGSGAFERKHTFFNNGTGFVHDDDFVKGPPEYYVSGAHDDRGMRLADFDSDGLTDILMGSGGVLKAWSNNLDNYSDVSLQWAPPSGMDFITSFAEDNGVRLFDINGDGRVDLVRSISQVHGQSSVYLNTGEGWVNDTASWSIPEFFVDGDRADNGLRSVDLNGDGLVDLLYGFSESGFTSRKAWLHTGTGWEEHSGFTPPMVFTTKDGDVDRGVRFADVNGDGLVDLLQDITNASGNHRSSWINTGFGWERNDYWASPEPFVISGKNKGRRIADVNGDGFFDILVGTDERYVLLRNDTKPYLLKNITNEFGGVAYISYEASTSYDNTGEDDVHDIGFNIWTVGSVIQDNGLSGDFSVVSNTSYTYFGGKYDYNDSEFRGFSQVNETMDDDSKGVHYFHQDDVLKGKEFRTESYGSDGSLLSAVDNNYQVLENVSSEGVVSTIQLGSSASYQFDGSSDGLIMNVTYSYDKYSNVIGKDQLGYTDVSGDEKYERYSFGYNESYWVLDTVTEYQLLDSDSELVRKTRYFYDDQEWGDVQKGKVTKVEEWANDRSENAVTTFRHDYYGNVIEQTDALGRLTQFEFGGRDRSFTFPDLSINALGHVTTFDYDVSNGNILSETKNGIAKSFVYDSFGRILKEVLPYDSSLNPTKSYSYSFDGVSPEVIVVSQKTLSNETLDTYYYYDGFANLVQIKTPHASGQVVKNIFYDGLFRVDEEQNPYLDGFSVSLATPSSSENKTSYVYDGLGRIVSVVNPDSTTKTTLYDRNVIKDYDENNNFKTYYLDSYDRIVAVEEHNTDFYTGVNRSFNTTYNYSTADELVLITDSKGNTFGFTYNSLGQKVGLDDPDLGIWSYLYDRVGNLVNQTDNRGKSVILGYDKLNRILHKNTSSSVISFSYDTEYQGTLSSISFDNFSLLYDYDDRLRVVSENLREGNSVDGFVDYSSNFMFDSADRLLSVDLPSSEDLDYYYDVSGRISEISGYVNSTTYNAFGNPLQRTYFNGKVTSFSYNSDNARLAMILTDSIQDLNYGYDSVGNILSIDDDANNRDYRMSYDNLDRLTNVSINEYNWVYSFDQLGNILKIVRNHSESTFFSFLGNPHAPTTVVTADASASVYEASVSGDTGSKEVSFYLVNDKNGSLTDVNYNVEFNDGNSASGSNFNLNEGEFSFFSINHTYSSGGDYGVNITALLSGADQGKKIIPLRFGAKASNLELLGNNGTSAVTQFVIKNENNNASSGWNWNCNNGVSSSSSFNMESDSEAFVIVESTMNANGERLECNVTSSDGSGSVSSDINPLGLEISGYNITRTDGDSVLVEFTIVNQYGEQAVSWQIESEGGVKASGGPTTLELYERLDVSTTVDFGSGGIKEVKITASSADFSVSVLDYFNLYWLGITNFVNIVKDGTTRILQFFVLNENYVDTTANVTVEGDSSAATLGYDETILVIIEEAYEQGSKQSEVRVYNGTAQDDQLLDVFVIKHIEIEEFETSESVSVVKIKNNRATNQNISWELTSDSTVSSNSDIELSQDESAFVIVESSDTGVQSVNFKIESGQYNDNESGVIVE